MGVHPTPQGKQFGEDVQAFVLIIGFYFAFGIIGLPATLVYCGPLPLVMCALLIYVMEAATIVLQVDNMQRAQRALALMDPEATAQGWLPTPDLHTMGLLFLPKGVSLVWDAVVILAYSPSLIYFMLEGVGISATALGITPQQAAAAFVIPCILVFSFVPNGRSAFPALTALTGAKFLLLCVCTVALGIMASGSGVSPSTDWGAFMHPFLMVSYIVGGTSGCLPANITGRGLATRQGVIRYLAAVLAALTVFSVMTVVWGVYVLGVVPQTEKDALRLGFPLDCSLEWAANHGQLASIPLIKVIQRSHASFGWVSPSVTAMLVGIWLCYTLTAFCFNHALNGFAASLTRVASSFVGFGPVSSAELLQLLPCDDPSPWGSSASGSASGLWQWVVSSWKSNRRFRLVLTSRGIIYAANAIVMLATALAFPSTRISVTVATLTTNIGGGVFPALLFMGARKRSVQQPAWLPELQARRLTVDATNPATTLLVVPEVPFALPEGLGHANMFFVLAAFALAGLYQIRTTTLHLADAHWGAAVTGVYVVLCLYHLVSEVILCLPALRVAAAAREVAAQGAGGGGEPFVADTDEEDLRAQLIAAAPSQSMRRRRAGGNGGSDSLPYLLSFEASCELADLTLWILYGLLPRERSDWSLDLAIALTVFHFALLFATKLRPLVPAFALVESPRVRLALSAVDIAVLVAWSVTAFTTYANGVKAGAVAAAFVVILLVELVLRQRATAAQLVPQASSSLQ